MMPTHPTPDLVMRQPHFTFGFLKHPLDPVALRTHPDQLGQGDTRRGVAQRVGDLRLRTHRAQDQQPLLGTDPAAQLGTDPDRDGFDFQGSLRAVAHRQAGPTLRRQGRRPGIDPHERDRTPGAGATLAARGSTAGEVPHRRVAGHIQDVLLAVLPQPLTELRGPAEFVVAQDPTVRQGRPTASQQLVTDLCQVER